MIEKIVQKREELFIQFTPEEMAELGIEKHDRFQVILNDDGTVTFKKFVKVDIDLGEFDRETLEGLINLSIEDQVPVDEVIRVGLRHGLDSLDASESGKPAASAKKSKKKPG